MTEVATDVEAKRVVVTSADAGPATAEAMLAALMKWCVLGVLGVLLDGRVGLSCGRFVLRSVDW